MCKNAQILATTDNLLISIKVLCFSLQYFLSGVEIFLQYKVQSILVYCLDKPRPGVTLYEPVKGSIQLDLSSKDKTDFFFRICIAMWELVEWRPSDECDGVQQLRGLPRLPGLPLLHGLLLPAQPLQSEGRNHFATLPSLGSANISQIWYWVLILWLNPGRQEIRPRNCWISCPPGRLRAYQNFVRNN